MAARGKMPTTRSQIAESILLVRGQKVLLDSTLASLYGVQTKVLVQAVKRNRERFPADFMLELSNQEVAGLRSQFVTSSWGGRRYLPFAFTEQGVAMLSSVLNSPQAVRVNIEIMRAFVRLREMIATNKELSGKLGELEKESRDTRSSDSRFDQCDTRARHADSSEAETPYRFRDRPVTTQQHVTATYDLVARVRYGKAKWRSGRSNA